MVILCLKNIIKTMPKKTIKKSEVEIPDYWNKRFDRLEVQILELAREQKELKVIIKNLLKRAYPKPWQ